MFGRNRASSYSRTRLLRWWSLNLHSIFAILVRLTVHKRILILIIWLIQDDPPLRARP